MRKSRFIEAQIIGMIKEQEAGMPTAEVCRKHGLSPAPFYRWCHVWTYMDPAFLQRLI
jgi:putative transposase